MSSMVKKIPMNQLKCKIETCERMARCKFLCLFHYERQRTGRKLELPFRAQYETIFCKEGGCSKPRKARGLCAMHYDRYRRHGSTEKPDKRKYKGVVCSVDECKNFACLKGMCRFHYGRKRKGTAIDQWRRGDPLPEILTIEIIQKLPWTHCKTHGYVISKPGGARISQHRAVWEAYNGRKLQPFENIHHINGIRDDNRIENLELWTKPQPIGQRPEDLVAWVLDHYRELVEARLALL